MSDSDGDFLVRMDQIERILALLAEFWRRTPNNHLRLGQVVANLANGFQRWTGFGMAGPLVEDEDEYGGPGVVPVSELSDAELESRLIHALGHAKVAVDVPEGVEPVQKKAIVIAESKEVPEKLLDLAQQMVNDSEFIRKCEEGWQAFAEGHHKPLEQVKKELGDKGVQK